MVTATDLCVNHPVCGKFHRIRFTYVSVEERPTRTRRTVGRYVTHFVKSFIEFRSHVFPRKANNNTSASVIDRQIDRQTGRNWDKACQLLWRYDVTSPSNLQTTFYFYIHSLPGKNIIHRSSTIQRKKYLINKIYLNSRV